MSSSNTDEKSITVARERIQNEMDGFSDVVDKMVLYSARANSITHLARATNSRSDPERPQRTPARLNDPLPLTMDSLHPLKAALTQDPSLGRFLPEKMRNSFVESGKLPKYLEGKLGLTRVNATRCPLTTPHIIFLANTRDVSLGLLEEHLNTAKRDLMSEISSMRFAMQEPNMAADFTRQFPQDQSSLKPIEAKNAVMRVAYTGKLSHTSLFTESVPGQLALQTLKLAQRSGASVPAMNQRVVREINTKNVLAEGSQRSSVSSSHLNTETNVQYIRNSRWEGDTVRQERRACETFLVDQQGNNFLSYLSAMVNDPSFKVKGVTISNLFAADSPLVSPAGAYICGIIGVSCKMVVEFGMKKKEHEVFFPNVEEKIISFGVRGQPCSELNSYRELDEGERRWGWNCAQSWNFCATYKLDKNGKVQKYVSHIYIKIVAVELNGDRQLKVECAKCSGDRINFVGLLRFILVKLSVIGDGVILYDVMFEANDRPEEERITRPLRFGETGIQINGDWIKNTENNAPEILVWTSITYEGTNPVLPDTPKPTLYRVDNDFLLNLENDRVWPIREGLTEKEGTSIGINGIECVGRQERLRGYLLCAVKRIRTMAVDGVLLLCGQRRERLFTRHLLRAIENLSGYHTAVDEDSCLAAFKEVINQREDHLITYLQCVKVINYTVSLYFEGNGMPIEGDFATPLGLQMRRAEEGNSIFFVGTMMQFFPPRAQLEPGRLEPVLYVNEIEATHYLDNMEYLSFETPNGIYKRRNGKIFEEELRFAAIKGYLRSKMLLTTHEEQIEAIFNIERITEWVQRGALTGDEEMAAFLPREYRNLAWMEEEDEEDEDGNIVPGRRRRIESEEDIRIFSDDDDDDSDDD